MTRNVIPRGFRPSTPLLVSAALVLVSSFGCGQDATSGGPAGSSGGSSGHAGTGGSSGSGTGGSPGSGGSTATGGSVGSGGSAEETGGSPGSGGSLGSGGSIEAGTEEPDGATGSNMLGGNGCAGGTCLNPNCMALGTPAKIGTAAEIGFETQPSYIPNYVIVPTFDDTPDGVHKPGDGDVYTNFGEGDWTRKLIQFFDTNSMHVDFFVNTNNFCDVSQDPECMATLVSMLKTQNPANHTVHHMHMGGNTGNNPDDPASSSCSGSNSTVSCDDELKGVESVVDMASNGGRPHLTRFRSPYGEPYQAGGGALSAIRAIVKNYAVHVGWQMDSDDSSCDNCKFTGTKIANNVLGNIGSGPGKGKSWGIVLMHGTYPWSYDAAKILFDPKTGEVQKRGFKLGTVEDVICWKYGKHSWELVQQLSGQPRGPN
jgi:hypothetical protein